jgi:succinylglutamate desuccinylase
MKKEILIIVATHGDEKIGTEVVKRLQEKKLNNFFDFLIANPKALKIGKRFIEKDLNRVYPGKKYSKYYEEKLAYKNLVIAKQYRYVIDIHEASEGKDDFIIVPKEKLPTKFPLKYIELEKVLLWPDPKGPISQILNNAIELEFGAKNRGRDEMIIKAANIIECFIDNIYSKRRSIKIKTKKIFYVYGVLKINDFSGGLGNLKDFKQAKNNGELFLPLLVGQYAKLGIVCYKMKIIN